MSAFPKFLVGLAAVLAAASPPPVLRAQEIGEPVVAADPVRRIPEVPANPGEQAAEPWLGVSVTKAPASLHAQLEGVPAGIGFIVDRVTEEGPAAAAGLQQYDFLWKLDDQLLINESQMLVLLNLHKVGDTVKLTFQRSGKDVETEAVLVARPEHEKGRLDADRVVMAPPIPGLPMQVVNLGRRVAEIRDADGLVRIERAGEQFGWEQRDLEGDLLQQGQVAGEEAMPEDLDPLLAGKLGALIRSLKHAEDRAARGPRHRVRRVLVEDAARP